MSIQNIQNVKWTQLLEEALKSPGNIGNTYCRFHNYSFGNQILFMIQGLKSPVASYKKWQELGRQVRKGEKASYLWVPSLRKNKEKDQTICTGFYFKAGVFQYSQTDGPEIEFPALPNWSKEIALQNLNIQEIPFDSTQGNMMGYYQPKVGIAINPVNTQPLKTLVHELAHFILQHTVSNSRTEFQAESTAYITLAELGQEFNKEESRAYIQGWLKNNVPTESDIKDVFATVNKILVAGRNSHEEQE